MIILDAYAVLAILKDEPAAPMVQRLIESDEPSSLTVLGVAEALDYLVRLAGAEEDVAVLDIAQLGLAPSLTVTAAVAVRAGFLRARHYHRRDRALSLADCVVAEVAREVGGPVATADPALLATCVAEGLSVIPLLDGRGQEWRG